MKDYTVIDDDLFETLMMSYREMLNALKFVEKTFPDVFIALSIDPYGLLSDAKEVFEKVEWGGKLE